MKKFVFIFSLLASSISLSAVRFDVEDLTKQDDVIWGFDFLSDGRVIFSERKGKIKIFDPKTKALVEVSGAPTVWSKGQGGLLDIRVHPSTQKIYMTYSEPVGDGATTALGMGTLTGNELKGFKKLFAAEAANDNVIHFGSRLEFDDKNHLFMTVGDRNERPNVQNLKFHTGKMIRLNLDGTVPKDNPFVNTKDARPEIWSLGHRSPQGLVRDPKTGDLWEAEMGPQGGDELNLIKRGANYGWPDLTFGKEYSGEKVAKGETQRAGMEPPVAYWVPSISPSGITLYNGDVFPDWKGNIFLGNLSGLHLRRLILDRKKVVSQEVLLSDLHYRIRNVRPGRDGYLYLSTDDGLLARLVPAK